MCDLYFLKHAEATLVITRVVQSYHYFVTLASGAHHGGYSTGYNITKAINFAGVSRCDLGRLTFQIISLHPPFEKCVLSIKNILAVIRVMYSHFWNSAAHTVTQFTSSTWQKNSLKSFAKRSEPQNTTSAPLPAYQLWQSLRVVGALLSTRT